MKPRAKWMIVAAAAAAATGCANRSASRTPGKVGEAEVVRTVQVIEPYGRAAEPELQSKTGQPADRESEPEPTALTDEIFDCTVDVQCTIVDFGCGDAPPVSVNRDHEALLRQRMQERTCEPAPVTADPDCPAGECEVHRLAVCDHGECSRLEFHVMGDTFTRLTLVHNRFTPQSEPR